MKAVKSEPIKNDFLDKTYDDDDGEPPWHISDNIDITSDDEE